MFYYSPSDPAFPDEKIVDFTRVISFPRNRAEELLPKKCLQLDADHRRLIKAKLGYYYFHEEECPITLEWPDLSKPLFCRSSLRGRAPRIQGTAINLIY